MYCSTKLRCDAGYLTHQRGQRLGRGCVLQLQSAGANQDSEHCCARGEIMRKRPAISEKKMIISAGVQCGRREMMLVSGEKYKLCEISE